MWRNTDLILSILLTISIYNFLNLRSETNCEYEKGAKILQIAVIELLSLQELLSESNLFTSMHILRNKIIIKAIYKIFHGKQLLKLQIFTCVQLH